jgi:hypothetical protein
VNCLPREVIGIMPAGTDVMDNRTEIWTPLGLNPGFRSSSLQCCALSGGTRCVSRRIGRRKMASWFISEERDLETCVPQVTAYRDHRNARHSRDNRARGRDLFHQHEDRDCGDP